MNVPVLLSVMSPLFPTPSAANLSGNVELPNNLWEFTSPSVIGIDMFPFEGLKVPKPPSVMVTVDVFGPTRVLEEFAMAGKVVMPMLARQLVNSTVRFMFDGNGPRASGLVVVNSALPVKVDVSGSVTPQAGLVPSAVSLNF